VTIAISFGLPEWRLALASESALTRVAAGLLTYARFQPDVSPQEHRAQLGTTLPLLVYTASPSSPFLQHCHYVASVFGLDTALRGENRGLGINALLLMRRL
jgi:hypothetical protein